MKKTPILFCLTAMTLTACASVTNVMASSCSFLSMSEPDDAKLISNLFTLDGLRTKVSSLAPTSATYNSSQKGILFYGYEAGGTASYKQILNGTISIKSIANTKDKNTPNLTHYSYKISDVKTNESFKIHVITSEQLTTYYVEANGKKAGEVYFSSQSASGRGYTKLFNNNDTFTEVKSTGLNLDTDITFDPSKMSIIVKGQTINFEVWNFKDAEIDGKAQIQNMNSFENYTVDVVFEEIIPNSKAELVVYSIGNKLFDGAIQNNPTTLIADLSVKGIVNKPYFLPTPLGEKADDLEAWIYVDNGENNPTEVFHSKLSESNQFVPQNTGDYYVYYKGIDGELRGKINVIASETSSAKFENNILDDDSYGYKSTIKVPNLVYSSNRIDKKLGSLVTIKLGDKVLVDNQQPGFEFTFDYHDKTITQNVDYTFIYKCENDNLTETITKKITVKPQNGVSYFKAYDSDYATGNDLYINKGFYYINGTETLCDVDVIYPAQSKTITFNGSDFTDGLPTLKLDSNGVFTIKYYINDTDIEFSTTFRSMPKVDELFTCEDASTRFGYSSSSDISSGVIGAFKNGGTITYNKVIDANSLTKNIKLISLDAQPKVSGRAEMSQIYVTVQDETDPDNYFEVRLAQGSGGNIEDKTFIRAQANGQTYGGLYYNSWFDINTDVAIIRWFNELTFGETKTATFNNFVCDVATTNVGGIDKMTLKIDYNAKNLHFIEKDITRNSFKSDKDNFLKEFKDQIDRRVGDGRLTKAELGTIHDPEITWQNDTAHDQGGFLHEHSFDGVVDTYSYENIDYVDLYYDNVDKALYTNFWYHVAGYQTEARVVKFCDFDEPSYFGSDKVWDGFKTNNVKISVTAKGVNDETGDVLIREICGNKFTKELLGDDDKPIIKIDDSVIPTAKVGYEFKPLDATFTDLTSAVEIKSVTVTSPLGENIELVNGKFTPSVPGEYVLTYKGIDSFNNETTQSITIIAKNPSEFENFTSYVDVVDGLDVQYGTTYQIPDPVVSGGSGKYKVEKFASVSKNGVTQDLEVKNGKVDVLHSGTFNIKIKCTDYLGEVVENNFTFKSTFSSDPVYNDKLILPERLFKDVPYQLKNFTCKVFEHEGEQQHLINVKARVTDASGTYELKDDMLYVPKCSSTVKNATIELFVNGSNGPVVLDTATVEIFDLEQTSYLLEGYFNYSNNTDVEAFKNSIRLICNDSSLTMSADFISPILDETVSLSFSQYYISGKSKQNLSDLDSLVVTLKDFENPDIQFDIKYTQRNDGVYASLPGNNINEYKVKGTFNNLDLQDDMGFSFDKSRNAVVDILGTSIGKISKCNNGDDFEGFTSGKVLMSIKVNGIKKDNGLYLKTIAGVKLNNNKTDISAPALVVNGSYGGYVRQNEEVMLPTATAYDVLSYCGGTTVSVFNAATKEYVKDVDGLTLNKVPANRNYHVVFETYGEYTVSYEAEDSAGNVSRIDAYPYYVIDSEPATLTFNNALSNDVVEINNFSSIKVDDFTIVDNASLDECFVCIYLVLPNSEILTLRNHGKKKDPTTGLEYIDMTYSDLCENGVYKFAGVGNYQLIYLISDSNGNFSVVNKTVVVK